jgi:hypothetical protein
LAEQHRSKIISEHNAHLFEVYCRRNGKLAGREVALPAGSRGDDQLSEFKALGLNADKLAQLEAESARRSSAWVDKVRQHRAGAAAPDLSRLQAAQGRFMAGSRGSHHLFPALSQIFTRKTNRGTQSPPPPPPPPPPGPVFQGNTSVSQPKVSANGHNYGWLPDLGDEEDHTAWASFTFDFQAPVTSNYQFTALMWAAGSYIVTADDRWWNSKYASAKLSHTVGATGPAGVSTFSFDMDPGTQFQTLLDVADDNINVSNSINDGSVLVYQTNGQSGIIPQGDFLTVTFGLFIECVAKGDGSYSEFDFSGTNQGIGCPICSIDQVP